MKKTLTALSSLAVLCAAGNSAGAAEEPEGFVALFDGKSLDGWEGDQRIWSVRDGAITGQTTPEIRVRENNFLIWKDEVEDFELRLKFRLEGGNDEAEFTTKTRRHEGRRTRRGEGNHDNTKTRKGGRWESGSRNYRNNSSTDCADGHR